MTSTPVVVDGAGVHIVIFPTLGGATVLRAAPFPVWQDEGKPPLAGAGRRRLIEEHP
jgi:hypothetical protein